MKVGGEKNCLGFFFPRVFSFLAIRNLYNASQVKESMLKVMEMQSIGPDPIADIRGQTLRLRPAHVSPWDSSTESLF